MILNKSQIIDRLNNKPPMVSNIKDIVLQLQPTGLDLTVKSIYKWKSAGTLDFDNSNRKLSEKHKVSCDYNFVKNRYYLTQGSYQVELNELFNIPLDVVGFTISRSSLQRCGAAILTGFFDAGFVGKGVSLLEVYNPHGLYIYKDARICQMAFHLTEKTEGYIGVYTEVLKPREKMKIDETEMNR